ncbi:MAG: Brefeldin A-inhibited guanine nucleotide-exchange protein 1 [Marteilia pararefringens]
MAASTNSCSNQTPPPSSKSSHLKLKAKNQQQQPQLSIENCKGNKDAAATTAEKSSPAMFLVEHLQALSSPLGLSGVSRDKWPRKLAPLFERIDNTLLDLLAIDEQEKSLLGCAKTEFFKMDDVLTKCFDPYNIALQSDSPDLAAFCLDTINKATIYYAFCGNLYDPKNRKLLFIDYLVLILNKTHELFFKNKSVEIQLIRLIESLIIAKNSRVHAISLITCIRICFSINSHSPYETNRSLASSCCQTIVSTIFQRAAHLSFEIASAQTNHFDSEKYFAGSLKSRDLLDNHNSVDLAIDEFCHRISHFVETSSILKTIFIKDAINIYQTLANLASHTSTKARVNRSTERAEQATRNLAINLVYEILINFESFISNQSEITIINRDIILPLLSDHLSSGSEKTLEMALDILFKMLAIYNTNPIIKPQIECFIQEIIVKILRHKYFPQNINKIFVLKSSRFLSNYQNALSIFISFDCSIESSDLISDLFAALCGMTSENQSGETPPIDPETRQIALKHISDFLFQLLDKKIDVNIIESEVHKKYIDERRIKYIWLSAIEKFKSSPIDGINILIDKKIIEKQPKVVAYILKTEKRLCRRQIGNFLSNPSDFSKSVLHEYTVECKVKDVELIDALREYLSNFLLPKESQQIERILMKFSSHYYLNNSKGVILTNTNIVYTIVYSIIFLMSDLHNPGGLKKFTKEKYVAVTKDTLDMSTFPSWYLEKIYDSVMSDKLELKAHYKSEFYNVVNTRTIFNRSESSNHSVGFKNGKNSSKKLNISEICQEAKQGFVSIPKVSDNRGIYKKSSISDTQLPSFSNLDKSQSEQVLIFESIAGSIMEGCTKLLSMTKNINSFDIAVEIVETLFIISINHNCRHISNCVISALIQLSGIIYASKYEDLNRKNLMIYCFLLKLSYKYLSYIDDQWTDILRCISSHDLLEAPISSIDNQITLSITHANIFTEWLHNNSPNNTAQFVELEKLSSKQETLRHMNFDYSHVSLTDKMTIPMACIIRAIVNEIFQVITSVSDQHLLNFMTSLCEISAEEVKEVQIRQYSLGKLFELLKSCIGKGEAMFTSTLNCILDYIHPFLSSQNISLATFTLDCLKQLLIQIIDFEEYETDEMQLIIIDVLVSIVHNAECKLAILEYIESSIFSLVMSHHKKLNLAWKPIIEILTSLICNKQADHRSLSQRTFSDLQTLTMSNCLHFESNEILFKTISQLLQAFLEYLYAEDDVASAKSISKIVSKILNSLFDSNGQVHLAWPIDHCDQDIDSYRENIVWGQAFISSLYMICKSTFHSQVNVCMHMLDLFLTLLSDFLDIAAKKQEDIFSLIEYIIIPPENISATKYTRDKIDFCIEYFLSQLTERWPKLERCFQHVIPDLLKLLKTRLSSHHLSSEDKSSEKSNREDSADQNIDSKFNTRLEYMDVANWRKDFKLVNDLLLAIGLNSSATNDEVDSKHEKGQTSQDLVMITVIDIYKDYKNLSVSKTALNTLSLAIPKDISNANARSTTPNYQIASKRNVSSTTGVNHNARGNKSSPVYLLYNSFSKLIFGTAPKQLINESLNYFNSLDCVEINAAAFISGASKKLHQNVHFPTFNIAESIVPEILSLMTQIVELGSPVSTDVCSVLLKKSSDELLEFILAVRICYMIHFTRLIEAHRVLCASNNNTSDPGDSEHERKYYENFEILLNFVTQQFTYLLQIFITENQLSLNRKYLKTYMMIFYTLKWFLVDKKKLVGKTLTLYKLTCQISSNSKAKAMAIACCDFLCLYEDFIA